MKYIIIPIIDGIEFLFRFILFLFAGFGFYFAYLMVWLWDFERPKTFIFWKDIDSDDLWEFDVVYLTPLDFLLKRKENRSVLKRENWS